MKKACGNVWVAKSRKEAIEWQEEQKAKEHFAKEKTEDGKVGLTSEKAFYDILISLRDQYNFEYGTDKEVDGVAVNDKCKALAKKIKDIIDTKSSFADWLNNQNVRNQLKLDIKICLVKNGYPPQYGSIFQFIPPHRLAVHSL